MQTKILDTLATEAREVLEAAHVRRRFDLSTRQGWLDLLEAATSKSLTDYVAEPDLRRLVAMCLKWLRTYQQVRFECTTRPGPSSARNGTRESTRSAALFQDPAGLSQPAPLGVRPDSSAPSVDPR